MPSDRCRGGQPIARAAHLGDGSPLGRAFDERREVNEDPRIPVASIENPRVEAHPVVRDAEKDAPIGTPEAGPRQGIIEEDFITGGHEDWHLIEQYDTGTLRARRHAMEAEYRPSRPERQEAFDIEGSDVGASRIQLWGETNQ